MAGKCWLQLTPINIVQSVNPCSSLCSQTWAQCPHRAPLARSCPSEPAPQPLEGVQQGELQSEYADSEEAAGRWNWTGWDVELQLQVEHSQAATLLRAHTLRGGRCCHSLSMPLGLSWSPGGRPCSDKQSPLCSLLGGPGSSANKPSGPVLPSPGPAQLEQGAPCWDRSETRLDCSSHVSQPHAQLCPLIGLLVLTGKHVTSNQTGRTLNVPRRVVPRCQEWGRAALCGAVGVQQELWAKAAWQLHGRAGGGQHVPLVQAAVGGVVLAQAEIEGLRHRDMLQAGVEGKAFLCNQNRNGSVS